MLFTVLGLLVVGVAGLALAAIFITPWPGALLIRTVFDKGSSSTSAALEKHLPEGIEAQIGLRYDATDADGFLDLYRPANSAGRTLFPVVWVHGGGFVSGSRADVGNYLKILAAEGFATISIDYSIAPGAIYPRPLEQLNAALAYLTAEQEKLGIDMSRLVLAGDSAGAQISAQFANIVTSPGYAAEVGIIPLIKPESLAGLLLFCGPYDLASINLTGPSAAFINTVAWSYSGTRDFFNNKSFAHMSVADYLTPAFPPAFISAGNGDPLEPQSRVLAERLTQQNVSIDTLFFEKDHSPRLGHEYQFNLDLEEGRTAFTRATEFLRKITAS